MIRIDETLIEKLEKNKHDAKFLKELEELEEVLIKVDEDVYDAFIDNGKFFPNIKKLRVENLGDFHRPSVSFLQFKKLKSIVLYDAYFSEQHYAYGGLGKWTGDDDSYEPSYDELYMDHMAQLTDLEEISFLALSEINKLKNFKKLKRIHEFFISFGTYSEEEYKEATKNIQIDKVEIEKT